MITQKDVAEYAGVSFITVSRVVNKESNVKESTRIKVENAIKVLGYVPGFAGKALNTGRCNTIAVVAPVKVSDYANSFYIMSLLQGIREACSVKDYDVILTSVSDCDNYDYLRPFRQRKVDGVIYFGMERLPAEMLAEIQVRSYPCVVIGDRPEAECLSWVDTDNYTAGYETARYLWNCGHRRIAFQGLREDIYNLNMADRQRGFCQALQDLSGSPVDSDLLINSDYADDSVRAVCRSAFERLQLAHKMPSAIFCVSDSRIPTLLSELQRAGLSVPRDVSLVGFDGLTGGLFLPIDFATNVQPLQEMGRRATEVLFERIQNPCLGKTVEVFPVTFSAGESVCHRSL